MSTLFHAFPRWQFLLDIPTGSEILNILFLLVLFFVVYGLIKLSTRSIRIVHSHWHCMFDTHPFAPLEFYESLEKSVTEKGINGLSYASIKHSEGGLFSANRVYLRINFREYMMDICAAPFAKESFFVSWWLGNSGVTFRDLMAEIPFIGRLFIKRAKTFYEQDTEIMFKETVARCVKETIEKLTEEKGIRSVDLTGWKGTDIAQN